MFIDLNDKPCQTKEDNIFEQEILNNTASQILEAKYEEVNTNKVATDQKQLNINQCNDL